MKAEEIRQHILDGKDFNYASDIKKGRIFTISAVIRKPAQCDLFIISASDLKKRCGLYNETDILEIIQKAINGQLQFNKRIR